MKTKLAVNKLKRRIEFIPGYDYIVQPTEKYGPNYGRHGLTMKFLVEGPKGVIQFALYTGWLPMIQDGRFGWKPTSERSFGAMAADIGYHSYKPLYEDQNPMSEKCEYLHNKKCYYDGSTLQSEEYFAVLCNEGEEALWKKMEEFYRDIFINRFTK